MAAVRLGAHALVFEGIRMQFVRAAAEGDAARFVVGRHNNQRFVGVLAVELVCHANGFVKIFHFVEHRGGIVAVASPVNLAAFHHKEETFAVALRFGELADAGTRDVLQSQVALLAVDGIRQGSGIFLCRSFGLEEDNLFGLAHFLFEILIAAGNHVASLFALCIKVWRTGVILIGRFQEIRTAKVVEARLRQLRADFIILAAIAHVGVESCRRGVVDGNARGYAHCRSVLLGTDGHAVNRCCEVGQQAERTVLRLMSRCQRRACCGGVGHAVCARVGRDERRGGKVSEAQRRSADAPFEGREIGFRAVYLVDAHAVADEIKHILGLALRETGQGD